MTNEEFDKLLNLTKYFTQDNIQLPYVGEANIFDVAAYQSNEKFFLDVDRRSRIELKIKIQTRYAITKIPLVRIDINSAPHRNPDGTKTSRNHIHIYRDMPNNLGNLPWAYDLETFEPFTDSITSMDFMQIFYSFCRYCNIETYNIQGVI